MPRYELTIYARHDGHPIDIDIIEETIEDAISTASDITEETGLTTSIGVECADGVTRVSDWVRSTVTIRHDPRAGGECQ